MMLSYTEQKRQEHIIALSHARNMLVDAGLISGSLDDQWLKTELIRRGMYTEFWTYPISTTMLILGWFNEMSLDKS